MAVPGRRYGLLEDEEAVDSLFDEVMLEMESDTPSHLLPLSEAIYAGDVDALRDAIDNLSAGSIDDAIEDGDTALHLSCLYGLLPCVQLLVERGANLESKDDEGAVPLHDASAGGFKEIVQFLINSARSSGCLQRMLDTFDSEGDTPLHHAARGEDLETVCLLLNAGASAQKVNIYGKTPAEVADQGTAVGKLLENAVVGGTSSDLGGYSGSPAFP